MTFPRDDASRPGAATLSCSEGESVVINIIKKELTDKLSVLIHRIYDRIPGKTNGLHEWVAQRWQKDKPVWGIISDQQAEAQIIQ